MSGNDNANNQVEKEINIKLTLHEITCIRDGCISSTIAQKMRDYISAEEELVKQVIEYNNRLSVIEKDIQDMLDNMHILHLLLNNCLSPMYINILVDKDAMLNNNHADIILTSNEQGRMYSAKDSTKVYYCRIMLDSKSSFETWLQNVLQEIKGMHR